MILYDKFYFLCTLLEEIVCGRKNCEIYFCEFDLRKSVLCEIYFCELGFFPRKCGIKFLRIGIFS